MRGQRGTDPYRGRGTERRPDLRRVEVYRSYAREAHWFGWGLIAHSVASLLQWVDEVAASCVGLVAATIAAAGIVIAASASKSPVVKWAAIILTPLALADVVAVFGALVAQDPILSLSCWVFHLYAASAVTFSMVLHATRVSTLGPGRSSRHYAWLLPAIYVLTWLPTWMVAERILALAPWAGSSFLFALSVLVGVTGAFGLHSRRSVVVSTPEWWFDALKLPTKEFVAMILFPDMGAQVLLPDGSKREFPFAVDAVEWLTNRGFAPVEGAPRSDRGALAREDGTEDAG